MAFPQKSWLTKIFLRATNAGETFIEKKSLTSPKKSDISQKKLNMFDQEQRFVT